MRGYFGIGVWQPKTEVNIGTLWRHAYLYGAAFMFVIGRRYSKQCSDTPKAYRHIPLWQFETFDDFSRVPIYDCQLVAIELDKRSILLPRFEHPRRAIYLLGAEDHGLAPQILDRAVHIVQIPTPQPQSMNVASAGTIVMYDRYVKSLEMAESVKKAQPGRG